MKKFIVKYKNSEKTFGEFSSKEEASAKLMKFINDVNRDLEGDYYYISPFDFTIEEAECKEVNEVITDFESAKNILSAIQKALTP